jgi:hypothetical protein
VGLRPMPVVDATPLEVVEDQSVPGFLESLGLSHLTANLRHQQLCPRCYELSSMSSRVA